MRKRRLPCLIGIVAVWVSFFLGSFPWLAVSQAEDNPAKENRLMEQQRDAYQSEHNLVKAIQKRLGALGYRPGPLDGIMGPKTRSALMAYQRDVGLFVDGLIGIETLDRLGLVRK